MLARAARIARPRARLLIVAAAVIAAGAAVSALGPLNPPTGPVAETGRTMIFDVPYTISAPGSYIVVRNLTAPANTRGITIAASNVTLDLGGFSLRNGNHVGPPGSDAIVVTGTQHHIVVMNGSISDFDGGGVLGAGASQSRVEHLTISNLHDPTGSAFPRPRAVDLGSSCIVADCAISNCEAGISTGVAGLVEGCTVANTSSGLGIDTDTDSIVRHCTASGGSSYGPSFGISVGDRSSVLDCAASNNHAGTGIPTGIRAGNRCTIARCTAADNMGPGIRTGAGCTVTGCTATGDVHNEAVHVGDSSTVSGCTITQVGDNDGVDASNGCRVEGNTINVGGSGGYGIVISGTGCRVEGNTVSGAVTGILIVGTGNIILRNTVTGGTQYSIAAGNSFGPIVNVTGVGDISGTPKANHPWANFQY